MEEQEVKNKKPSFKINNKTVSKYIITTVVFTIGIAIFSFIMAGVAAYRNDVATNNYDNVSRIYSPLEQNAPTVGKLSADSYLYDSNSLTPELVAKYIDNTSLASTDATVVINADFVKKGLVYQPTYETIFNAEYVLVNELDEPSIVAFEFPFPINSELNEISNAKLIVDGEEIQNAKTKISLGTEEYDYYGNKNTNTVDGLKWEGKISANDNVTVSISYNTVGLSVFTYEGIENSKGAQDFDFDVTINGTRAYDVKEGLSVDSREFGDKTVTLKWEKPDLYSKPLIKMSVGDKLDPSTQVSRVYLTMAPIYLIFMTIILYLTYKFGKKLEIFDIFLLTVIFGLYFPFIHYLSSFTIDPTIEVFSAFKNVGYFSMPLYGAFALAASIMGGLMYYFLGRTSGFKFASKFGLPSLVLFLGFFPLVVTVPEYSMLLVLIGVIALTMIILQVRVKMVSTN